MPRPGSGGVLCCGNVVVDILVRPVDRIAWSTTAWVESIEQHLGGNGANTAYTAGILGVPARLLSLAGRDALGELAISTLRRAGVDLAFLRRSDAPTATTVALVSSTGDRMFLHRPGASSEAFTEPVEFTPAMLDGMSRFHLGNPFALPAMRRNAGETVRRARAAGLCISVDTGWDALGRWMEDLGSCLPHTDLLFVNEEEGKRLSGEPDASSAARRLRASGPRVVVMKLGAAGCLVSGPGMEFREPAFDVPVVDTTGAGDCFAGAFLAALVRGNSYQEAARFANAVAALTIQGLGASTGVRSWEETVAWMAGAATR
jgi:sugar/nucleoside kinase (ribokinase family)